MMVTTVQVAGDVTVDCNIAQSAGDVSAGARSRLHARAHMQFGGAALLAQLIEAVNNQDALGWHVSGPTVRHPAQSLADSSLPQSHAVWAAFAGAGSQRVWRVSEFLGTGFAEGAGENAVPLSADASARVLVLDDANMGFRAANADLTLGGGPWVVLKLSAPVAPNPMLESLVRSAASRLVVVVSADDLRLTDVHISRNVSWERTAQDLVWEIAHNTTLALLAECAHLVVSFRCAGTFVRSRLAAGHWLFFDPAGGEGEWQARLPGDAIGYNLCLAASLVREIATQGNSFDIHRAVQAGVRAMRALHQHGYGKTGGPFGFPHAPVAAALADSTPAVASAKVEVPLRAGWTIIADRQTRGFAAAAESIVLEGGGNVLHDIPCTRFGGLVLIDRTEIESYRSIGTLFAEYQAQGRAKPLSIAVFGPPGAGKSFGVEQLAKSLPGKMEDVTFNVSQFRSPEALAHAFHRVRDIGLSGKLPLVFWDEFDTRDDNGRPYWLRHFLAPMQDGRFQEGETTHPIGKAIFVFAGGTVWTQQEFAAKADPDDTAKGRDFLSRLKGYIDVLGPNARAAGGDEQFLIRRAFLLRSIAERNAPQIVGADQRIQIDGGVLRALLRISDYRHGVRSMESMVTMSTLSGRGRFDRSFLPATGPMNLHVDAAEFQALVQMDDLRTVVDAMAERIHQYFLEDLVEQERETHPANRPFAELPEHDKEQNRDQARDIPFKLARVGRLAVRGPVPESERAPLENEEVEFLAQFEHDRWMALKLL